jgi:hypothetical protein
LSCPSDDRIDGKELPLTHELLSLMLGTHRPGVTTAVNVEAEGLTGLAPLIGHAVGHAFGFVRGLAELLCRLILESPSGRRKYSVP